MHLVRLYSNQPAVFEPIEFNRGLSAVVAEIRVPGNHDLDTHNLGKSTVAELLDFCLLRGKNNDFFLFKHEKLFAGFVFYLEIKLSDGSYLTIGRAVIPGSRIDLVRSETSIDDATLLSESEWDHVGAAFERAEDIVDGALDFEVLKPWRFRKLVGYLIRSQHDYLDVFQLKKFAGKHKDWKPFVAHLMGMDAQVAIDLYDTRHAREEIDASLETLTREWSGDEADPSVLAGLTAVKNRQIQEKQSTLDSLNFRDEDSRLTAAVVEETETRIAALNEDRYQLTRLLKQLDESLSVDQIQFKPKAAQALFSEAGVELPEHLTKDYEQLIAFNRAITDERRLALEKQVADAREQLDDLESELKRLNQQRTQSLQFLRQSDALAKYKSLSSELAELRGELGALEAKRDAAARLAELRRERRRLTEAFDKLQTQTEEQIDEISNDDQSTFGRLRDHFGSIIRHVLGEEAILAISLNSKGGLEFTAEFIGDAGTATSDDRGTSYRKLLCMAFDLAILRTYSDVPFPQFVYHDGAFEQLDPRKKENLIEVLREYSRLGIQPIISLLDSDLPSPIGSTTSTLDAEEVVLRLHDEGRDGRLFKMEKW